LKGIVVKSEARIKGISSLDLKQQQEGPSAPIVEAQPSSLVPMLTIFGVFSTTALALTYSIMKFRN
jgi:hypothetical protein